MRRARSSLNPGKTKHERYVRQKGEGERDLWGEVIDVAPIHVQRGEVPSLPLSHTLSLCLSLSPSYSLFLSLSLFLSFSYETREKVKKHVEPSKGR
jgi:hypothetical protein